MGGLDVDVSAGTRIGDLCVLHTAWFKLATAPPMGGACDSVVVACLFLQLFELSMSAMQGDVHGGESLRKAPEGPAPVWKLSNARGNGHCVQRRLPLPLLRGARRIATENEPQMVSVSVMKPIHE